MIPPSLLILLSGPFSTMAGLGVLFTVAGRTGLETSSPVFQAWFVGIALLTVLVPAAIFMVITAILKHEGLWDLAARGDTRRGSTRPGDKGHLAVVTPIR